MQLGKKTIVFIILAILALVAIIVIYNFRKNPTSFQLPDRSDLNQAQEDADATGYEAKGPLTDEDINIKYALQENEKLQDARVEIAGASPISPDDTVMTYEGEVADNSAAPASANAPKRTQAIDKSELTTGTIMINGSAAGFSPKEISTTAGEPTTIALTSTDDQVHVFKFSDPSLNAISLGAMPGETRAITFNAPARGTYDFFCEVPEHKDRGEVGVMMVK